MKPRILNAREKFIITKATCRENGEINLPFDESILRVFYKYVIHMQEVVLSLDRSSHGSN